MEFNKKEWTGNWVNFEKYIYSAEAAMQQCWAEAEEAAKAMPMFKRGSKELLENGLQYDCSGKSRAPGRLESQRFRGWN